MTKDYIEKVLVPLIKSIDAAVRDRINALEASVNRRFESVQKTVEEKNDEIGQRLDCLENKIFKNGNTQPVLVRLARLEDSCASCNDRNKTRAKQMWDVAKLFIVFLLGCVASTDLIHRLL